MSISLTQEDKNTLSVTNGSKPSSRTWDESTETWDEAEGTWDVPGTHLTKEDKNTLSITNEDK